MGARPRSVRLSPSWWLHTVPWGPRGLAGEVSRGSGASQPPPPARSPRLRGVRAGRERVSAPATYLLLPWRASAALRGLEGVFRGPGARTLHGPRPSRGVGQESEPEAPGLKSGAVEGGVRRPTRPYSYPPSPPPPQGRLARFRSPRRRRGVDLTYWTGPAGRALGRVWAPAHLAGVQESACFPASVRGHTSPTQRPFCASSSPRRWPCCRRSAVFGARGDAGRPRLSLRAAPPRPPPPSGPFL